MTTPLTQTWSRGKKTASADTAIIHAIPGHKGKKTKLSDFAVSVLTTAHTLTVMSPLGVVALSAVAAGGQAVVVLASDPGKYSTRTPAPRTANNLITTNDLLVFECPDGTIYQAITHSSTVPVTNVDGTVTVTLSANLPTNGLSVGARCWFFGITTDVNPYTAEAHPAFTLAASSFVSQSARSGSLVETPNSDSPMLIYDNNATAASVIENVSGIYAV